MGALGRLASRAMAPIQPLSTAVQVALSLVAAIGGGTILGLKYSPAVGVVGALGLLLVLAVVAGLGLQRELDSSREKSPDIRIGEPTTKVAPIFTRGDDQTPQGFAAFVCLPISNHRRPAAQEGTDAEHVHARIRTVPDALGTPESGWQPASWSEAIQQIDRPRFAPAHDAEVAELTLRPNGREHTLDTVAQLKGNDFCGIWNQEAYWEIGATWPFVVELEIEGSNIERRTVWVRVTPDTGDGFVPKAELLEDQP